MLSTNAQHSITNAQMFHILQAQHAYDIQKQSAVSYCLLHRPEMAGRKNKLLGFDPQALNTRLNPYLLLRRPEMAGRKNHWPHSVQTYTSLRARGRLS